MPRTTSKSRGFIKILAPQLTGGWPICHGGNLSLTISLLSWRISQVTIAPLFQSWLLKRQACCDRQPESVASDQTPSKHDKILIEMSGQTELGHALYGRYTGTRSTLSPRAAEMLSCTDTTYLFP